MVGGKISNRTYQQRFKSIASRLRFVLKEFYDIEDDDDRQELCAAVTDLKNKVVGVYGERIANEIYWDVEEK